MSDELNEIQQITHEYRKSLAAYEARTGRAPQTVDHRGSGEEREKFAKMDADLTSAELIAQNKALEARLAKLESQPMLEARAATKSSRTPSDDSETRSFLTAMATGKEYRAQTSLGTDSSGAAVPTDMERRIVEMMYQSNVMRSICPASVINSKRTIPVESALPTTYLVAESAGDPGTGTAATLSFPTFGTSISVTPFTYVTAVKMSMEFIADAIGTGDIGTAVDYVARKCAVSMALAHEKDFVRGAGSTSAPQGIAKKAFLTNTTNMGTNTALTDLTADQVIDTVHLVAPQYRASPRFRWLISDAFLKAARKLKANNEYVLTVGPTNATSLTTGIPGTIYGIPYAVSAYVPYAGSGGTGTTEALADTDVVAVVGDFNYYEIFDRMGLEQQLDPYTNAINRQTTMYLTSRTDGKCTNKAAFAAIVA